MSKSVFKGKVAIVTGGASGIGQALARELAWRGATVVITDIAINVAEEVATELTKSGCNVWSERVDVTDYDEVNEVVEKTLKKTGRLDYMFNNAGVYTQFCNTDEYTIDAWRKLNDINYGGVVNGVLVAYKAMANQGYGHIVNTSSVCGLLPCAVPSYSGSKYAITGMSLALREEGKKKGVKVSVLCPGLVRTHLISGEAKKESPKKLGKLLEKRKPINADELAKKSLDDVAKNKFLIIHPWRERLLYYAYRYLALSPRYVFLIDRLLKKI